MDRRRMRTRLPLALPALLGFLAVSLVIVPAIAPPPAEAVGPLPECRLDDFLTVPRGYDDWSLIGESH